MTIHLTPGQVPAQLQGFDLLDTRLILPSARKAGHARHDAV